MILSINLVFFEGTPCREHTAPEIRPPCGTRERFLQVTGEENTPEAPAPAPSAQRLVAPGAQAVRFADAHCAPGGRTPHWSLRRTSRGPQPVPWGDPVRPSGTRTGSVLKTCLKRVHRSEGILCTRKGAANFSACIPVKRTRSGWMPRVSALLMSCRKDPTLHL